MNKFTYEGKEYYKLPYGSYFNWVEVKWFEKYRTILFFKNGAWIPQLDKLKDLEELDREYRKYKQAILEEEERNKSLLKSN